MADLLRLHQQIGVPIVFDALHHQAHEECFIASSVLTEVRVDPVALPAAPSVAGTAGAP